MLFTGQTELLIDAKGRLAIPAKHRARLDAEQLGNAWMCVPWTGGILRLYPEKAFEELAKKAETSLTPDQDQAELETSLFGFAERLEMDASGRITLSKWHMEQTAITGEVFVIGVRDRLEVRGKQAWLDEKPRRFAGLQDLANRINAKRQGGEKP